MSHLGRAISLVNAAADGAGDEEVSPLEMAAEIRRALDSAARRGREEAASLLGEALEALADGQPADRVAALLYAARASSQSHGGAAGRPW